MSKIDVYMGNYIEIDEVTQEESNRLASNACIIGMPVTVSFDTASETFKVSIPNGDTIGTIRPRNRLAFRDALENGWTCKAWLSLVYLVCTDEGKLFKGEIVYQFYRIHDMAVEAQAMFDAYAQKTSDRLAAGERPCVTLTGSGYDQVAKTGDWVAEDPQPLPISTKQKSGTVIFKRKRSISDKLVLAALDKNPGCHYALVITTIVLAALILVLLYRCVFAQ